MRILPQPIKVVDNFFEAPDLWRHYALKQSFSKDEKSTWPGVRTTTLDQLNLDLFNKFASLLITHVHDKNSFSLLKINFASVDGSYNLGWLHQDEPHFNIAGVIFLDKLASPNTGISFYEKISNTDINFNDAFFEELKTDPAERNKFISSKTEQREYFKKTMTVENNFNRCVMFAPNVWHAADGYFGDTLENSRLTITFFGISV
jgi:hypothetical protein